MWEPRAAGAGEGEGLSSAGVTGQRAGRVELSSESSDVDIEGQFTPSVMVPEQTPIFLPGPSSPSSNPASAAPSRPADGDELGAAPPGGSRGGLSNLGRDGTAAQPGGLASNSLARPQVKVEGDRRDLGAETLGAGGLHRAAAREVSTEVDGRGGGQSLQTSAPSLAHVLQGFPNLAASLASIVSPEQAAISFRLMQVRGLSVGAWISVGAWRPHVVFKRKTFVGSQGVPMSHWSQSHLRQILRKEIFSDVYNIQARPQMHARTWACQ